MVANLSGGNASFNNRLFEIFFLCSVFLDVFAVCFFVEVLTENGPRERERERC